MKYMFFWGNVNIFNCLFVSCFLVIKEIFVSEETTISDSFFKSLTNSYTEEGNSFQ